MPPLEATQIKAARDAAYWQRREANYDSTVLTRTIYASSSQVSMNLIKRQWEQYCRMTNKDPKATLKQWPIATLDSFFDWMLFEKDGTINAAGTLQAYWNTLNMVRKAPTGGVGYEPLVKTQMKGVRQRLTLEHSLRQGKKDKPILRAEDEFELLNTLWSSSEMGMDHERQRAQLALLMQLAGITGSRPASLLGLCYGHLKVSLLRDPEGGKVPRVLIDFKFNVYKQYVGPKDVNTFPVPDIPCERCLLLCPQTTLLGIASADEAFVPACAIGGFVRTLLGAQRLTVSVRKSALDLCQENRNRCRVCNEEGLVNLLRLRLFVLRQLYYTFLATWGPNLGLRGVYQGSFYLVLYINVLTTERGSTVPECPQTRSHLLPPSLVTFPYTPCLRFLVKARAAGRVWSWAVAIVLA